MHKDILIVADLGAAGNLVKNIILLGNVDWPLPVNPYDRLTKQYSPDITFQNWLKTEQQLQFWKKYYGIDLSNYLDYEQYVKCGPAKKPIVWLNHSAFWQLDEFDKFCSECDTIYVFPKTPFGLEWQVRSYCEKKTVEKMHNFSFANKQEYNEYMQTHTLDQYYENNILNMKEIIDHRQKNFSKHLNLDTIKIALEDLIFGNSLTIISQLNKINLEIDLTQAAQLITAWRNLHWPVEDTQNWAYTHLFYDKTT